MTVSNQEQAVMTIPAFSSGAPTELSLTFTASAEKRLIEARTVNPITYTDLEHCFNESYRELRTNLAKLGFMLAEAEKTAKKARAEFLIDKYPELMKDRPKSQDNADMREAFLTRDDAYMAALDRVNQLKATEALFDGKIKVMENVCRYMKKQMDLILRSGLSGSNHYGQK